MSHLINATPMTAWLHQSFSQNQFDYLQLLGLAIQPTLLTTNPIYVLPILSKILEKIVFIQLHSFFDYFNLFNPYQFGFRNKFSTSDPVTDCVQYICYRIVDDYNVFSIFLDFINVLDCVDRSIFIINLYAYGVRGVASKWYQSYLKDTEQNVVISNVTSPLWTYFGKHLKMSCFSFHMV